MRETRNAQNILMTNLKGSDHSADLDADGTLILKYIKQMGREDTE
jgi:hypothetical protein